MLKESASATNALNSICPDTGCNIHRRPEWTDIHLDDGYKTSISLIDRRILLSQPTGYVTLAGVRFFLTYIDEVIDTFFPKHTLFFLIEDLSRLNGAATEARRHFIKTLKKSKQLGGLVIIGTSPLFKISIKLGRRLYKGPVRIEVAKNYADAVRLAQILLSESIPPLFEKRPQIQDLSENQNFIENQDLGENRNGVKKTDVMSTNRERSINLDGYRMTFKAIDHSVLYSTVEGFIKEEHVPHVTQLLEIASKELTSNGIVEYIIADVTHLQGATRKARKAYSQALKKWAQTQPFKMFIYVGVNRFMRTATNLARPLMPFIRVADDLKDALSLIKKNRRQLASRHGSTPPPESHHRPASDQIQSYVEELLGYLGAIDWEHDGLDQQHGIEPSHPFFPVFEAVKLIKDELDDLFYEKSSAEKKLQQINEELEHRVKARTADLERLNRDLKLEIHERKEAVAEFRRAKITAEKANRAKSEFLANMSHELRTPLNHIIGFTEIVLDQHFGPLNTRQTEHLQDVAGSSQHLLSLINDILDLSKVEAGKLTLNCTSVHLPQLLRDSLKMIQEKAGIHNITLNLDLTDAPQTIEADNRKLRQILYNLLSNAVKFTPDGGRISVLVHLRRSASATTPEPHESTFQVSDNEVAAWLNRQNTPLFEITVQDTGIGIRHNDRHRIFNAFEQADGSASRRYQGTGLGLSLTQKLVELHRGRIWVESPGEGHGSVFRCLMPFHQTTKT